MAVCPNCTEDNPDKARFCMVCASPLDQAPQPQAEERKVVSVLFVDLVGFTARSHDLDPEDIHAVLTPYHQRLKREIERFGGTVEKFIGDAVMAVFGAPVAYEDDAERAVRAALRITQAIEELNEDANLGLSTRAAVNTGEGLVNLTARPQDGEGMVTGDVVNTASRLQNVAPVKGVVVGEVTYRSTQDMIDYEAMEPVTVKGKPDPVPVWRALSARSRFGIDVETRYSTPFIGRDLDLATLKTAYQRALRESSVQLVTVVGEPGVGKSRLLAEFASYLDEQDEIVSWRQGRSLPYGEGITFWALGEIIKTQAGINESDSPDVAKDKITVALGSLMTDEADRAWLQQRLAPLVGATSVGGTAEKEESFAAWLRFLETIAAKDPLVLVFEDLHWADASLLEFIEHLVEWSTGVPILIVGTARPELFESYPHWAGGTRNSTTISLSPLTDAETAQLISALLSQAVLPAEIHAALLERASGNPLYAEEFIRMLSDRGLLQQRGRTLTLDPDTDIPMPDNVQALIAARLDTLPTERKSLLHNAAVIGKVFWSGAVASLSSLDQQTTRRSLQSFVRKQLIRPARISSVEAQQEYSFWHALIRDVAYGQIPRRKRADKHERAAQWIEGVAKGERITDHAEVLAHHYDTARELLISSSMYAQAATLVEPAVRFVVLAGDRVADLDAARARQYYEKALGLLLPGDRRRAKLLVKLGLVSRFLGEVEDAIAHYHEAARLFRAEGDKRGEGEATARLSAAYYDAGRSFAEAQGLTRRSIDLLEQVRPGPELVYAYKRAAEDNAFGGTPAEALAWAEKAVAIAQQVGDVRGTVTALGIRGLARCDLGLHQGLNDLREAYKEAVRLGFGDEIALLCSWLCYMLWPIEGPVMAVSTIKEGIERSERRGLTARAMQLRAYSLSMLYDLGEWRKLLDVADECMRWSEQRGEKAIEINALPYVAHVLAWRRQLKKAHELTDLVLLDARRTTSEELVPALAVAALVAQMRNKAEVAVARVEELERATEGNGPWRSRHLPTALRALIAAGELEKAENLSNGIDVTATRDRDCVLTGKAILAEAKGDMEQARNLHQQAAQRWADYGFVLEEGQAHLGLARCLMALGDRETATEPLQKARAVFSRLGAQPLTDEVDRYLGQDRHSVPRT
jgi:class 3 adenylate cyclase/tetratricopeptide (TPR) repeat protein